MSYNLVGILLNKMVDKNAALSLGCFISHAMQIAERRTQKLTKSRAEFSSSPSVVLCSEMAAAAPLCREQTLLLWGHVIRD